MYVDVNVLPVFLFFGVEGAVFGEWSMKSCSESLLPAVHQAAPATVQRSGLGKHSDAEHRPDRNPTLALQIFRCLEPFGFN
jgi:hypothetical protein